MSAKNDNCGGENAEYFDQGLLHYHRKAPYQVNIQAASMAVKFFRQETTQGMFARLDAKFNARFFVSF